MTQEEYEQKQARIAQHYLVSYNLTAKELQECHDIATSGMETEPELQDINASLELHLSWYENYLESAISSKK